MSKVAPKASTPKAEPAKTKHKDSHHPRPHHHAHELGDSDMNDADDGTSELSMESGVANKYGLHVTKKTHEPNPGDSHGRTCVLTLSKLWRIFSAILFSPIFLRQRNIFYLCVEVLVPGMVVFIIFGAFTGGLQWRQAHADQKDASTRLLNFPELTMESAMARFREKNANPDGRVLVLYYPVNNITTLIMQTVVENLKIRDQNSLFRNGQGSEGVVGMNSELEMYERAMFHRMDRLVHGSPVAVRFKMDMQDKSSITGVPYDITFSISLFDESIHETLNNFPFIEPADNENWQSPYVSSGFIGLQCAIEESIIRMILERQMQVEMAELLGHRDQFSEGAKAKAGLDDAEDLHAAGGVDQDLLEFLKRETATFEEEDNVYDDSGNEEGGGAQGRSASSSEEHHAKTPGSHSRKDEMPMLHRRMVKSSTELPQRSLKMVSYNMFGTEDYRKLITFLVTISLVISYCFMSFFIVKQIARENISGIKDLLQMHGMPHYMHWFILFLRVLIFRAITSLVVVLALKLDWDSDSENNNSIIKHCQASVLFLIIYVHQLSLSFMNFFIAITIRSVNMCGVVAISVGVLSFYLPEIFYNKELIGYVPNFVLTIIFPNWCMRQVLRCLIDHETDNKGLKWSNLFELANVQTNTISVGRGVLTMFFIGKIYFRLAVYIDKTNAAKLFPERHRWFHWCQFKESALHWIAKKAKQQMEGRDLHAKFIRDIDEGLADEFEKPPVYEEPAPEQKCFVHIRNLCKNYGKYRVALDSINMNIMHEEVTVILGHSGCGKSTLVSILAGLVRPSDGYAVINGLDVQHDATKAREYIGMCPQKQVSFNLLTVREHVKLCYILRGYGSSECDQQVVTLLTKLKLWNVRSSLPDKLTTDELRRLGIAMALVDTPKVLLLDQPTYGMDTTGRKEIWDIIHTLKRHHTIVVTTNYMDEAEHLADRLAFLAHGRLICYGTLPFLQNQYDTGYFLKIQPMSDLPLDSNGIVNLVRKHLHSEDISIRRHTRIHEVDNLILGLPNSERDKFLELCEELEEKMGAYNISRYSIRRVNLNDVFIRICSSTGAEGYNGLDLYVRRDSGGHLKSVLFSEIPRLHQEDTEEDRLADEMAFEMTPRRYFMALMRKRLTLIKTTRRNILVHFLIPMIFIWMVVFQAKQFVETSSSHPERKLTLERFGESGRDLQLFYRMGTDDYAINYTNHLSRTFNPFGKPLAKNDSLITTMYEVLKTDPHDVGYAKDDHMIAFELRNGGARSGGGDTDTNDFVGYFASGALHSAPIAMNLMSNVYLRVVSAGEWPKDGEGRAYKATVANDPMPQVNKAKFADGCGAVCILLAVLMSYSVAFVSHFCISLPMMERTTGMKHLQQMTGVPSTVYWFSHFAIDTVIMFSVSFVIVMVFLADLSQTFYSPALIFALWLLCILYLMWSGLMYVYFMSSIIPESMNGYNVLAVLHLFLGIIPMLWVSFWPPLVGGGVFWRNLWEVIFPPYTLTVVFYNFFTVAGQRNICRGTNPYLQEICDVRYNPQDHIADTGHFVSQKELYEEINKTDPELAKCCDRICVATWSCFQPPTVFNSSKESWSHPGIITDTIALLLQGFLYCGLLLLSDKKLLQRLMQKLVLRYLRGQDEAASKVPNRFKNVRHESLAVRDLLTEELFPLDTALVCMDLTKSTTSKMIIKDFCLEVKKGQCIAILGRGNSGKTSLSKMIAGQTIPTNGNCYIHGYNLIHHRKEYLTCIGYCPQRGCLCPDLTGAQMVELMGSLRGLPQNLLSTHVVKWLKVMGLSEVAYDPCKEYGDGMRQRLRAAMAFIGEPEIILLDEPTSSVDPNSRERFWSVLEHLNKKGHTIIFTTYSTEEAFTLADKVIIIGDGSVQCMGTPEKLQDEYGRGHTIFFKLKHGALSSPEISSGAEGKMAKFKRHLTETFRFIDLLDEWDDLLLYFLRDTALSWAEVYRRASYLAMIHSDIVDYYEVSEGEIDDIFVYLAGKHHELGTPRKSNPHAIQAKKDMELKDLKAAEKNLYRSKF